MAEARARTDELFAIVRPEAMYERPISERHRIIFYVGHLEAFDWNLLADRAFGLKPFQPAFDQLFSFGIDPVDGGLPTDTPADWPALEEVLAYTQKIRDKIDQAIDEALSRAGGGEQQLKNLLEVAIEHRLMHAETLAYMLHRLPAEKKIGERIVRKPAKARVKSQLIEIPAGRATLGLVM
ncbi:MAG: DinB family protein, partial [Candidatus Acidiferrum sp.]